MSGDTATDADGSKSGPRFKRVLLKISGEALMGELSYGLDPNMVDRVAGEVQSVLDVGGEVCLVIG